jgi:IS30 family transposase
VLQRLNAHLLAQYLASIAHGTPSAAPDVRSRASLVGNEPLRQYLQDRLSVRGGAWSPEQIAQILKIDFPADVSMQIGHEAIYQALYVQSHGALKREVGQMPAPGTGVAGAAGAKAEGLDHVTPETLISRSPPEVADLAVPGHRGRYSNDRFAAQRAIDTLVERSTRFTMLIHLLCESGYGLL